MNSIQKESLFPDTMTSSSPSCLTGSTKGINTS